MADKRTILIADDDSDIRESTHEYLEMDFPGCNYEVFNSGQELEARLRQGNLEKVALAIMDNSMPPGLDGSEIISTYAGVVNFPFILHYAGVEDIGKKAVKDGAVAYFKKPAKLSEIAAMVGRLLAK